ncbi:amidohydrolase family protein [Colletotrichum zoysiae]|uniref:6-methylsalicylate decarboxylase n=1 Tax=Colletotrichum zoysiae TaxID=1216348 RepID=A0AAD9HST7_9PEZI|nr:amidohydrolase family protein [Colletotrichum zoysiae]
MSKIDVHHHVYSPAYTEALKEGGGDPSGWYVPPWTIESDRELCKSIGVKTAILSHTAPGPVVKSDPREASALARKLNEFSASLRDSDPEHYGFFASVPSLADTELCLAEIRYALDELKADGVMLMTRYGSDNHYLGHPDFIPIWQELNTRKAVVLVHPTHPVDVNLVNKCLPQPMMDYPHETARTAMDLILSDTFRLHARDCRIILSHGGGTLPMVVSRVAGLALLTPFINKSAEQIREEVGWFYYDTAMCSSPEQLAALQVIAKPGHILFGSDFPNCPPEAIERFTAQLDASEVLASDYRNGIENSAAKTLFPRLN